MTKKLALIAFCFCACFGLVGITYADTYASTTKENTAEQEQEINEYSYAAEPPVQFRLSHLSRRSEPL